MGIYIQKITLVWFWFLPLTSIILSSRKRNYSYNLWIKNSQLLTLCTILKPFCGEPSTWVPKVSCMNLVRSLFQSVNVCTVNCKNDQWLDCIWFCENAPENKPLLKQNPSLYDFVVLLRSGTFFHKAFHKTEVQKNILRYLLCLNLRWIKS